MRYNDNREVNEMKHREMGEREVVNSSMLLSYLGSDNYLNKAEEMLLDILNGTWELDEALSDIRGYDELLEKE